MYWYFICVFSLHLGCATLKWSLALWFPNVSVQVHVKDLGLTVAFSCSFIYEGLWIWMKTNVIVFRVCYKFMITGSKSSDLTFVLFILNLQRLRRTNLIDLIVKQNKIWLQVKFLHSQKSQFKYKWRIWTLQSHFHVQLYMKACGFEWKQM